MFANGDCYSLEDAHRQISVTGCDGVMSARGLLENPALFAGFKHTPLDCIKKFVKLGIGYGTSHFIFHHHLMYMTEKIMTRAEKNYFNTISTIPGILDYFEDHYGLNFLQ